MSEDKSLPSNSFVSRERDAQKKEPIVTKRVARRRENGARKFAKLFLAEDIGDVKDYLIYDLVIPGAKRIFQAFIERIFW